MGFLANPGRMDVRARVIFVGIVLTLWSLMSEMRGREKKQELSGIED